MLERIKWILTRPRTMVRAWRVLGLRTTLRLVIIRLTGTPQNKYRLRLPRYSHPIFIRGGRSTDALALYEVMVTNEYALTNDLDSPAFIIDGGANVGMASVYFLNRYPTARVIAVEPGDANLEMCRLNLEPYGNRVTLVHGAIWKSGGRLSFEMGDQEWLGQVREDQSGSVAALTMASLIARGSGQVDLLKLDIEGSEREIFGPDAHEWLPRIRNIAIELHGDDRKDQFFAALDEYRYDLSLHTTWTGMAAGTQMSCYLAICQNIHAAVSE
jgi:FkbM family methyltransferase